MLSALALGSAACQSSVGTQQCYEYGVKHYVSHLMPEIKSGEDTWITCAVPI
jgi:hypothetical protein